MRKTRCFRLVKVFKWTIHRTEIPIKAMSKLCKWGRSLKQGAIGGLCCPKSEPDYIRVGHDPVDSKPVRVPKGHLAVYVGEREDDTRRYLVPVIYFNHPLFGNLLREAENEYGFNHPGGIQIRCQVSEFEIIRTRIAATAGG